MVGGSLDLCRCIGDSHGVAGLPHDFQVIVVITDNDGVLHGFAHEGAQVMQTAGLADAAGHDL